MDKFITLKTVILLNCVIVFFSLIGFFKGCSNSSELSDLNKKHKIIITRVEVLNLGVDSLKKEVVSEKDMKQLLQSTMYRFLIYEEDIDKGKISLSEIQNRLDKNN